MKISVRPVFTILLAGFQIGMVAFAQDFLPSYDRFSSKSPVFLMLEDGSKITGTLMEVDRKKQQIETVTVQDSAGNVRKLAASDIKSAYLKPSAYSKIGNDYMNAMKVQKWDDDYIKPELIAEGYCYFEKANVELKGEKSTLLLQMLNPGFGSRIKVFYDPYAQETGGFGMGDIKLTGGDDKSYYVQVGDKTAVRAKKKDYDRLYKDFYADCPAFIEKIAKDLKWNDFAKHIYAYTAECK
jgi:hypothetical protein